MEGHLHTRKDTSAPAPPAPPAPLHAAWQMPEPHTGARPRAHTFHSDANACKRTCTAWLTCTHLLLASPPACVLMGACVRMGCPASPACARRALQRILLGSSSPTSTSAGSVASQQPHDCVCKTPSQPAASQLRLQDAQRGVLLEHGGHVILVHQQCGARGNALRRTGSCILEKGASGANARHSRRYMACGARSR